MSGKTKLPAMMVLKRKAIRIFPNGLLVGLYYNDRLDRWISIPYEGVGISEEIQEELDNLIEELSND